jgi:hypothetical protein
MREFIQIHVKCFENWEKQPVHFVGSIGFHFKSCLEKAAQWENIELGRIVRQPIDGLVDYHIEHQLKEILA